MADDRLACCLSASMIATKSDKVEHRAAPRGERWCAASSAGLSTFHLPCCEAPSFAGAFSFFAPATGRADGTILTGARSLLNPPNREKPDMKRPKFEIISDGVDIFIVADGVKVAKRGGPDTPQAKTWVSLEPGWTAMDKPPDTIVIEHNDVRVH